MAMAYVQLYYDFIETTEALTDAERGRLVVAMLEYARNGKVDESALVGNERILFPTFRRQLDRDSAAYAARVRQNAINGAKGGRPRKSTETEKNPSVIAETEKRQEQEQDQYKDKDEDEDKHSVCAGASAPAAPTRDEVADYCRENRLSIDPDAFWNHYQANGWRAGGRPIRDWRAKLREWAAQDAARARPFPTGTPRASPTAPANPALNYAQRDYTDDDSFFIDLDAYAGGRD